MVRMLNLGSSVPSLPKKEEKLEKVVEAVSAELNAPTQEIPRVQSGLATTEAVNPVPTVEVKPNGEEVSAVEPFERVVAEQVGEPVTLEKPKVEDKEDGASAVVAQGTDLDEDLTQATRAEGISVVGVIMSNLQSVTVYTRKKYVPATAIAGYLLRNDGIEELEVFEDVLVKPSGNSIAYVPNTSLLSTSKNISEVKKVPFAIGETKAFTRYGLLALAQTCKELGNRLGLGEALPVVADQLVDLHPELTKDLALKIASKLSFAIEVRQAKSETGLVPDNPEGLFSKLSPALGLATSAKSVKMDVAKALVENNLVQGKSPEEVVAMVAGRLNITLPQGLLLPVNLFEETQDIKGVPFAVPGSRVKEEFREVFGVYEQYNKPKAVKENSKPKVKKQPKEEQPAVSSQVNLAKYFEHYVK
jgi:hypothetical protein